MSATSLEQLDDYVSRAMSDADAEAFEEALFDAAATGDAPELRFVDALRRGLGDLARRGTIHITLLLSEAEQFQRTSPMRVRMVDLDDYQGDPFDDVAAIDIGLVRYNVPLEGVKRVDVEFGTERTPTLYTIPEVRFDAANNCVVMCCEAELMMATLRANAIVRLFAVDGDERRLLREFRPAAP
ncbi:MAG: hypothetical protein IRZ16_01175 [Myxococcaceae bacterium]|nr:hypothetical protein [Myxococcaceae bacterium]